jgi:hypothetical protein
MLSAQKPVSNYSSKNPACQITQALALSTLLQTCFNHIIEVLLTLVIFTSFGTLYLISLVEVANFLMWGKSAYSLFSTVNPG